MKRFTLTTFIIFLISFAAQAQYDFPEWGIGASYGRMVAYSDLRKNYIQNSYSAAVHWNYSPYLPFALEAQTGKLSGGGVGIDPYDRAFTNNYLCFNLHGDLQLGELVDFQNSYILDRLKGFYSGIGIGVMFNNITSVQRYAITDPSYMFPGKDHSNSILIPLRFGYEFKVYNYEELPVMGISVGYSYFLTFSEGLDGYNDPTDKFKNNAQDMFGGLVVGLKFNFGNLVRYNKPIRSN